MEEKKKLQEGRFSIYQQVEKKIKNPNHPDFKGLYNDGGELKSFSLWVRGTFGTEGFNMSGEFVDFKDYSAKPSEPKPMTKDESQRKFAEVRDNLGLEEGVTPAAVEQPPVTEEDDVPF
tara:strand:+ start:718 stop:1074 length:357 start_codon:yes stop_codon:yes gene_type:complete